MPRPRSKPSQSRHDRKVKQLARQYERKGYKVKADLEGYERPESIRKLRPDLRVKKGGHETVVEVETKDSVDTTRAKKQQKAFKDWSEGSPTKHFKKEVT